MRERHRYSHVIPDVNRCPAAENGDNDEEGDDEEEEEEQRQDEEEEEEEPVWTAYGLIGTPEFPQLLLL